MLRKSSSEKLVVFGVRESNLYRLKGQPIREIISRMSDREQGAGSSEG
jgi:hypothetical protein